MSNAKAIQEQIAKLDDVIQALDDIESKAIEPIVNELTEQRRQLLRVQRRLEHLESKT